jgi:hypothetical protein
MAERIFNIPIEGTVLDSPANGKALRGDRSDPIREMNLNDMPGFPAVDMPGNLPEQSRLNTISIDNLEYHIDEGYCVCKVEASPAILNWLDKCFVVQSGETESEVDKKVRTQNIHLIRKDLEAIE